MRNPLKKKATEPVRRQRMRAEPAANGSFSYYGRRNEEVVTTGRQSPRDNPVAARTAERIRRFWLQRFGVMLLLLALFVGAVNSMLLSTNAKVTPFTTENIVLRDQATYQQAANEILASAPANRTKLTINTNHVSQEMLRKFPELTTVSVSLPLVAHRPVIYVAGSRPALILSSSSGSFVVSSTGKVLAPSTELASSLRDKLPSVTDQSGVELKTGVSALTSANVHFIEAISAQLAAKSYPVSGMTLPRAAGELDVQINGQPYFIKFNLQSNTAKEQAGTFFATMSQLQKTHATASRYVDVRVDGRAYYL